MNKYTLTIKEASDYFGIGENKLRSIVAANSNATFILRVGNRVKIKTKLFEQWIDSISYI